MYYTDVMYRQGQISSMGYYFSQAWNVASIGTGALGIPARSLTNFRAWQEAAYAAAAYVSRVLGWGGIANYYYKWKP